MIYISTFLGFNIATIVQITKDEKNIICVPFLAMYIILAVTFLILTSTFAFTAFWNISLNQTQFEVMRAKSKSLKYSRPKTSCFEAWEEVFGTRKKWFLWIFPIPAFHNVNEYNFVNDSHEDMML